MYRRIATRIAGSFWLTVLAMAVPWGAFMAVLDLTGVISGEPRPLVPTLIVWSIGGFFFGLLWTATMRLIQKRRQNKTPRA